tara:strand:+ start:156 stop:455 length:300 start_codon:yes stop_codon:yes gene_type:complete
MGMKQITITLTICFILNTKIFAWCSEPSAPSSFSKPTKPSVPYCVNEYSRTHTCDDWTINQYNSDIEQYNYDVQRYASDLRDYVNDAQEYANCEIRSFQ